MSAAASGAARFGLIALLTLALGALLLSRLALPGRSRGRALWTMTRTATT